MSTQPVPTFYIPLLDKTFDQVYSENISNLDSEYGLLVTLKHEPKTLSEQFEGWEEKFSQHLSILKSLDEVVSDESLPIDMRIIAMGITTTHIFDLL